MEGLVDQPHARALAEDDKLFSNSMNRAVVRAGFISTLRTNSINRTSTTTAVYSNSPVMLRRDDTAEDLKSHLSRVNSHADYSCELGTTKGDGLLDHTLTGNPFHAADNIRSFMPQKSSTVLPRLAATGSRSLSQNSFNMVNFQSSQSPLESSTQSHLTSLRPPKQIVAPSSFFPRVTAADRWEALLGRRDLNRTVMANGDVLYREEFCGSCGIIHPEPDVLDTYSYCGSCAAVIREPANLRQRVAEIDHMRETHRRQTMKHGAKESRSPLFAQASQSFAGASICDMYSNAVSTATNLSGSTNREKQMLLGEKDDNSSTSSSKDNWRRALHMMDGVKSEVQIHNLDSHESSSLHRLLSDPDVPPLEILFATYGDPFDASTAVIVTDSLRQLVNSTPSRNRIHFKPSHNFANILKVPNDPSPGENKQLRVRYRMLGAHATLILDVQPDHHIPTIFLLTTPKQRYVRIFEASYGHPKGRTTTGRMHADVTEILQSLVDQNGGTYLNLGSYMPLTRVLGDPCPGYSKDLRISYEIMGRGGFIVCSEVRGYLTKKIVLTSTPRVAPLVYVVRATYGITPTGKKSVLSKLQRKLKRMTAILHRKKNGVVPTPEESEELRGYDQLVSEIAIFRDIPTEFIDVTHKLQLLADKDGLGITLNSEEFDPNFVFGRILPGRPKLFELELDCNGHDSERMTEAEELQDSGYRRNFISIQRRDYQIVVDEDPSTTKGIMRSSVDFRAVFASPNVVITRAIYGELDDPLKCIDVTGDLQGRVVDRGLILSRDLNLNHIFKRDPSPGRPKHLHIQYMTRGFRGNVRVREKDDLLAAGIELGYAPIPPLDESNDIVYF